MIQSQTGKGVSGCWWVAKGLAEEAGRVAGLKQLKQHALFEIWWQKKKETAGPSADVGWL